MIILARKKYMLMPETTLKNGMKVFCLREEEVTTLYEQIQEYFRNGIQIKEGDIIFDVGANIGLFTLWVYQSCNQNAKIYAFEPIPAIFEVLQRNVQRFGSENLKAFPFGLSREAKVVTFAYYPQITALSNAYPEDANQLREQLQQVVLRNIQHAPPSIRWLRFLPAFLRPYILAKRAKKTFQTQLVSCELRTISDIICECNIEQIDLLKVDVEKSELDVLLGINEQDWSKIKQVVVEVHDLNNRVDSIQALLKTHGLNKITVEQEPIFQGSNIYNIYARRW